MMNRDGERDWTVFIYCLYPTETALSRGDGSDRNRVQIGRWGQSRGDSPYGAVSVVSRTV